MLFACCTMHGKALSKYFSKVLEKLLTEANGEIPDYELKQSIASNELRAQIL